MSEIVSGEVIQRLEERHAELIDELDALNRRLEEALNTFQKPSTEELEPVKQQPKAEVVK